MQHTQQPLRPVARGPDLTGLGNTNQQLLQSLSALRSGSAFHPAVPAVQPAQGTGYPGYPEVALFSQLHQLFPGAAELAAAAQRNAETSARGRASAKSNDSGGKSSSAYASRHQAAEQRRRTRINER